jgi:hypothetical protein
MKTDFRPAYVKDFEACWNIIDQARRSMIASGRHQWTSDYPAEHDIKEDINNGAALLPQRLSATGNRKQGFSDWHNRLRSR